MNTAPESEDIHTIFRGITEIFEQPVAIGTRCESPIFYRVEDLSEDDLNICATAVGSRINDITGPEGPEVILKSPGGYSFFAERLAALYCEVWGRPGIILEQMIETRMTPNFSARLKNKTAVLVTDVITTARSSLELHSKATMMGIKIVCWASLIDRTLGPGPVPVVSAFTGAPVQVLSGY